MAQVVDASMLVHAILENLGVTGTGTTPSSGIRIGTGTELSLATLPTLVKLACQTVQSYKTLRGAEKKALVIVALQQLIEQTQAQQGADVAAFSPIFVALVPTLIDEFVSVSKDGLDIEVQAPKGCMRLFSCCCGSVGGQ